MIRYPISLSELENAIEKEKSGWLEKARTKTESFRSARDFNESSGRNTWSEIKGAYMKLQNNKCAYCERLLASEQYGKIEHDVEHYRPKNAIISWPTEKMKEDDRYTYNFSTGEASNKGYYLLSYNPLNYATACKPCNTPLKSNYFPIAGQRLVNSADLIRLREEGPYMIYPIGDIDEDPEELITFQGILPVPKRRSGTRHRRARVTIDLFALDIREELIKARAIIIRMIWQAYRVLQNQTCDAEDRADAQKIITTAISPKFEHTNCARSFYQLCQENQEQAREFKIRADRILESI